MAQARARMRILAGLLAALLVAVLVAGPGLDSVLCAGDGAAPAASAATIVHHERGRIVEQVHRTGHSESSSGCQHGHVQAANACAETEAALTAVRLTVAMLHRRDDQRLPPSAALPGLERPPRA